MWLCLGNWNQKNISKQEIDQILFDYVRYNLIYEAILQKYNISKTYSNPKLEQNKELKEISLSIGKYSYNIINQWINDWYNRNKEWLSEKNEKYPDIWLENTNNLSEWINSILKTKLWIHKWLKWKVKKNLISYLLYNRYFTSTHF